MVLFCCCFYGFYVFVFLVLMLIGCGQEINFKEMFLVKVGVVMLKVEVYENIMELFGWILVYCIVEVCFQVGGIIFECLFEEGSLVEVN